MRIVIKNARIINGLGQVMENGFLAFDENGILEISQQPIQGEGELDGSGKTVMPGLVDCHVHLGAADSGSQSTMLSEEREAITASLICAQCQKFLQFGITTVRNMGSRHDADIEVRNLIDSGLVTGPRVVASGRVIAITGGHGYPLALESDTPDEALKAARTQIKKGAQMLKMMATGGVLTPGSVVGAQQLSYEQMRVVVQEAKQTGRITGAHCIGYEGTRDAILSGMTSIEHGYLLDEALVEEMCKRGTYLCPTVIASRAIMEAPDQSPGAQALRKKLAPIADYHLSALALAFRSGVKIAAGTDCGTPYNPVSRLCDELHAYTEAGMSNMEALVSATKTGAELLQLDHLVGSLEPGKQADFIVLDGNPLEDIYDITKVERTYCRGKLVFEKPSAF